MKVLMFGWEFPPHISGGLGTACFGLTQSLANRGTEILFVTPTANSHKPFRGAEVISASNIPLVQQETTFHQRADEKPEKTLPVAGSITSINISGELQPYYSIDYSKSQMVTMEQWDYQPYEKLPVNSEKSSESKATYRFTGGYGPELLNEVSRYAQVANEVAKQNSFDVIHAHDWMTYPAGVAAKQSSGKPLVIHVHATEFDRSGDGGNQLTQEIEKMGMTLADQIIAVSQLTKDTIVSRYHITPDKITVVHNGVMPKRNKTPNTLPPIGKRVITFLGRITHQKGPGYFVDAAYLVHQKFPDVHFVMAGSGDLVPKMMKKVAALNMSSHFHFTGFLNSDKVDQVWAISDMYVMPSVSEPFGIAPLEAMLAGVPVIISNQSGVAEVVNHAIKVDFWNTKALANAMLNLLAHKSLANTVKQNSTMEIKKINWDAAAEKINKIYHEVTQKK